MRKFLAWLLRPIIQEMVKREIVARLPETLLRIEPDKYYILVLPDSLSKEEVAEAVQPLHFANLLVIQADNVRMLEFD